MTNVTNLTFTEISQLIKRMITTNWNRIRTVLNRTETGKQHEQNQSSKTKLNSTYSQSKYESKQIEQTNELLPQIIQQRRSWNEPHYRRRTANGNRATNSD